MLKNNLYSDIERNLVNRLIDGYANPLPPPPPPIPAPVIPLTKFGVNLSGLEGGAIGPGTVLPGTLNTNYYLPSNSVIDYFANKGFTIFRLPVLWERMQPTMNGSLDSTYMSYIDSKINYITQVKGLPIILDCHQYMERRLVLTTDTRFTVGSAEIPISAFVDLWTKLANIYKSNSFVRFDLCNEPKTIPTTSDLITIFQALLNGVRSAGATNLCYLHTRINSSAQAAVQNRAERYYNEITDSANNWQLQPHCYFNPEGSGGSTSISRIDGTGLVPLRLHTITELARAFGKKLCLGESGFPPDIKWQSAIIRLYDFLAKNDDVWESSTFWVGGDNPSPNDSEVQKLNPNSTTPLVEKPQLLKFVERSALGKFGVYPGATIQWDRKGGVYGITSFFDFWDYSRASIAWDWSGNSVLQYAVNELRITERGARIEFPSANIMPFDDWSTAAGYTGLGGCSIEGGTTPVRYTAPDGSQNMVKLLQGTSVSSKYIVTRNNITTPNPNAPHAFSLYSQSYDNDFPWVQCSNGANGAPIANVTALNGLQTMRRGKFARTWGVCTADSAVKMRIGFNDSLTFGNTTPNSYTGTGKSLLIVYPQIEPNRLYPGTPILTTEVGAPLARAGDIALAKAAQLSKFNTNFTFIVEFAEIIDANIEVPLLLFNGIPVIKLGSDHKVKCDFGGSFSTATAFTIDAGGTPNSGGYRSSLFRNTAQRFGLSVNFTTGKIVIGGQDVPAAELSISVPAIASIQLAQSGACLSQFAYLPGFNGTAALNSLLDLSV